MQRIPSARCNTSSQFANLAVLRTLTICCAAVALTPGIAVSACNDALLMSTRAAPGLLTSPRRTTVHCGIDAPNAVVPFIASGTGVGLVVGAALSGSVARINPELDISVATINVRNSSEIEQFFTAVAFGVFALK
jgi:hypothetical protein